MRTDNVAAADGRRRLTRMPPAPCSAATGGGGRTLCRTETHMTSTWPVVGNLNPSFIPTTSDSLPLSLV